jgi:hypothetical protein
MVDEEMYLQLIGRIDDFLFRVRQSAESLNVLDRQKILRLVVKEVLVSGDTVTTKHSIPTTPPSPIQRRHLSQRDRRMCQVIYCVGGVISPLLAESGGVGNGYTRIWSQNVKVYESLAKLGFT